jgi:flagellin-like protein
MKKPVRKDEKAVSPVIAVILMVAITVVLAGVLYLWVVQLIDRPEGGPDNIVASLEQGDGNMTSGCLFILTKGSGERVRIDEYRIRISEKGKSPITLEWPEDGNSSYSLGDEHPNDSEFWDATERIGFDAPPHLTDIEVGEIVEVSLVHLKTNKVVFSSSFTYHD